MSFDPSLLMAPPRKCLTLLRPCSKSRHPPLVFRWGFDVRVNITDVTEKEISVKRTGEKLTFAKSLSDAFGLRDLLVHQEVLLPGRRASGFHFHSEKEEIFYVLSGTPSLLVDDRVTDLEPGDFVGFASSANTPHMLFNRSPEPATILTIGTCSPTDETTYVAQEIFNPSPVERG
jgi:uncharacterized cupin superfamily protein